MAGISESYSAKAMLDSHMISISREGMTSLEAQRSPETEYKLRKVTEKFLESVHVMLNEPSVGLFRIQEHVRRSIPQLVDKKKEMQSFHQKVEGMCYDVDYSIKTVKSMHNIQHFTIIQECLKSAMASKQSLDKARLDRKNKKPDQETASSSASSDVPEIIEEEGTEVQGFICPNCMQLWENQDELLEHWTSSHDISDHDRNDSAANPEEEFAKKNEQIKIQESNNEEDEFAHVTAAESMFKNGSEPLLDSQGEQEQDEQQDQQQQQQY